MLRPVFILLLRDFEVPNSRKTEVINVMSDYFISKSSYLISLSTETWGKKVLWLQGAKCFWPFFYQGWTPFCVFLISQLSRTTRPASLHVQAQALVILSQLLGRPNSNIRQGLGESCHSRFHRPYSWSDPGRPFGSCLSFLIQCFGATSEIQPWYEWFHWDMAFLFIFLSGQVRFLSPSSHQGCNFPLKLLISMDSVVYVLSYLLT